MVPNANPDIIYRSYLPQDKDQVWNLHLTALKETGAFIENAPYDIDADLGNIEKKYLENKGAFIVAVMNQKIIAMGGLKKITDGIGEIKRMRVYKEFHAQGIGKTIYKMLEQKARELGYNKLILDTTDKQKTAQAFYLKYGFEEVRREKRKDFMLIYYEKNLKEH